MADITAKRGPIDPNDYVTNQGVATQGQVKGLDRDIRYAENQPSTWDSVMGGIKDVMNVGKSALSMVNSYKDLDVKDTQIKVAEEQIEASKLNRQKTELDMERVRQTMKYQGIKNDLALREYRNNNEYVTNFSDAIANNDYDKAVQLSLSDPVTASKNSGMLLYVANNLESMGKEAEASQLRMISSQNMSIDQLQKMYDLPKVGQSGAISKQKLDYENFKNLSSVFQSGILRNGLNTIEEIDTNPRLTLTNDIGNELLQNCEIRPMANGQQVDAINSILNSISGKDNGLQSLELDDNKNKYQSAQTKLSYAVVSCKDPKDPNKVVDRILAYDGKVKQQVPKLDKYGNFTGTYETITNDEVVNRLASNQTKAKNARDNLMKAPNITPDTTPNKDIKKGEKSNTTTTSSTKFSELPTTTQEIISKNNNKSFDEYQKDMREEITKNSVPDEQGNTVIGKDIVNWGLEDLKDKVVKILQKDPDLSKSAEKIAEQDIWTAAHKANDYFKANDITEPAPQDIKERIEDILKDRYSELTTTQNDSISKKAFNKLSTESKKLYIDNFNKGIHELDLEGNSTNIDENDLKQAIGKIIADKAYEYVENTPNLTFNSIEDLKNIPSAHRTKIFSYGIIMPKLKTDYPEIYEILKKGEMFYSNTEGRKKDKEIKDSERKRKLKEIFGK